MYTTPSLRYLLHLVTESFSFQILQVTASFTYRFVFFHLFPGMGTALKILLTDSSLLASTITRDDVVALINTLHKFSESIALSDQLMSMYYAETPLTKPSLHNTATPVDTALAFVSAHMDSLSQSQSDALVHALITHHPQVLQLAQHFSEWQFVRHALITLNLGPAPDVIIVGGGLAGLVTALSGPPTAFL